ncbi:MAG: DUF3106 domain-containing protein [Gallionella sp.]
MDKLPDVPAPSPSASTGRQADIPGSPGIFTVRQAGKQAGIARLPVLAAALVATCFSLGALAADTAVASGTRSAAATGATSDHKLTFQERIERMKTMTPEQQKHERDMMRQEMENMSPGQRAEQRKEIREHWEQMSPEERDQVRARMQEHWKSMPPEQREERRKEMREHFKNMSPQERQQFKSDMDMIDGMPPPGSDNPRSKADAAANSPKG